MDKHELRQLIRSAKARYSAEQLDALSIPILERLEMHPRFTAARTVLLYHALPDEVRTAAFLKKWYKKKTLLLPVVVGDELELRIYQGEEQTTEGAFGISEPTGEAYHAVEKIDLAVVPGVAFDAQGNRLGRGRGFYDRLLPQLRRCGVYLLGMGFTFQHVEAVPCEAHDVPMDEII